jgi:hypothetical protein
VEYAMNEKFEPAQKIQNLVVARYRDGRLVKGVTYDFGPNKKAFHVMPFDGDGKRNFLISLSELKAVFFVKSFEGKQDHPPVKEPPKDEKDAVGSMKMKITFFDGETLIGTTQGYAPERLGFFVVPIEKDDNNLRIFALSNAVEKIETWK